MRSSASPRPVTIPASALAVAMVVTAAGCTICPDPFDYSGPVPNGSAPHHDFHARSNGIAPLGGVRRPWPPVVQATPGTAEPHVTTAAGATPAADETDQQEALPDHAPETVLPATAEAAADAGATTPELPAVDEPTLEEILPPVPPRRAVVPPLRETPGWGPRG